MEDLVKSLLSEMINGIVSEHNSRTLEITSYSPKKELTNYVPTEYSKPDELDALQSDLYASQSFLAEDIFPELDTGAAMSSTNHFKICNYSEIATQTSQSLLGHFSDSTAQTSQTLGIGNSSEHSGDQRVPLSPVNHVEANIKIRRIGLSKKARTNPLHKFKK